jgi:hypothetical protein
MVLHKGSHEIIDSPCLEKRVATTCDHAEVKSLHQRAFYSISKSRDRWEQVNSWNQN